MKMYIGVIYTENRVDGDIITIYASNRKKADELLAKYSHYMYDDIEEITVTGYETYIPDAPDATVIRE